ncbi:hypothetical protein HZB89_01840, partial [archaeon]|nr:hypothetical protein [archaeon]
MIQAKKILNAFIVCLVIASIAVTAYAQEEGPPEGMTGPPPEGISGPPSDMGPPPEMTAPEQPEPSPEVSSGPEPQEAPETIEPQETVSEPEFVAPGGCQTPEECGNYCASNPDACFQQMQQNDLAQDAGAEIK